MRMNTIRWIRLAVGYVFITSGMVKLIIADFKAMFVQLGIPFPEITLLLIALLEIACGSLIIARMYMKQAVLPLIIIMLGAIFITKIPILTSKDIFSFVFEARLDIVMLIMLFILWQQSVPKET